MGYYSKKIDQRQAIVKAGNDAELLLHAIVHGDARWEWFEGDRTHGEVCVGGLRYSCRTDENGVPILYDHLRAVLNRNVTGMAECGQ